ncbi:MAG: efflux RND transporter periplasmic adaptor subunit [Clostridiales Family XIII bacterium]|jgi:RND family efflux transporter MFP subunit|nr:efflux RND transporter periplasmic adaptor subunit [Clostridiales Family XIII bacterium]
MDKDPYAQNSVQDPNQISGRNPDQAPNQISDQTPGQDPNQISDQTPAQRSAQSKKSHAKVVLIVVLVIVALVALAGYRLLDKYLNPEVAAVDDTVNVTVAEAVTGDIEVTSVHTGKITAEDEVNVVPKIPGKATSVNVELGERVEEGDILFIIDPSDVEAQQKQAEIQRDAANRGKSSASGAISDAQSAVSDAKDAVKKAKKAVKSAKKDLKSAKSTLKKAKKLPQTGTPATIPGATQTQTSPVAAAQQLVAQAEAVLAQAEAGVVQAKGAQKQAEAGVRQARSGYDQADAQYKLAEEGVSSAENAIGETTVRAPITGYVTGITVQRGGMVSQAMPAAVITGTGKIQVTTTVAENIVGGIHDGDAVDIYVRAVSEEPFTGTISRIVPAPPAGQTTYPVVIDLNDPGEALKPGMFAEIGMVTGRADGVVLIPSDAVIIRDGKEVVATIDGDNNVRIAEVATGIDDGMNVEIQSGISAGERVVTEGQHYINDETKVRIAE